MAPKEEKQFQNIIKNKRESILQQEVLRSVIHLPEDHPKKGINWARGEILTWAKKRAGSEFPSNAWSGSAFEVFSGGRTTIASSMENSELLLWSLKTDDPDKYVPGRVWTNEITIGWNKGESPRISLRQIVFSGSTNTPFVPASPTFIRYISEKNDILNDETKIIHTPNFIENNDEVYGLVNKILDQKRKLPIIVFGQDERDLKDDSNIEFLKNIAKNTTGISHTFFVPANLTYALSDRFGRSRSVFHGAIRLYLPDFDATSDPYGHPLYLSETLLRDPQRVEDEIRTRVAKESLRRHQLGHDVLTFTAVRSAVIQAEQDEKRTSGATDTSQLEAAASRIKALEEELKTVIAESERSFQTAVEEEERAKVAEGALSNAIARVRSLQAATNTIASDQLPTETRFENWDQFVNWVDGNYVGKIVLTPLAKKNLRSPLFSDIPLAVRCVKWLAEDCLRIRQDGGQPLANIAIFEGVENSPCGSDMFEFNFQGRKQKAEWHVKNGGNTRTPERCIRIYYAYDEQTQQIVIADMPAHRRSGAT